MLLSCSLEAFSGHRLGDALAAIAATGLRYVELKLDGRDVAPWEELLHEHGLAAAMVDLADHEALDADAAGEGLPLVKRLGARHAVIFAGEEMHDAAQRRRRLEHLRRLGDVAGELGMTLCLDTRPGLCGDSRAMGETMAQLDHPAVQLCFDTGAYLCHNPGANGEVAFQRVLGHVGGVRLSDWDEGSDDGTFPPLGFGGVDFARALQILQGVEFTGPCSIYLSPPSGPPADALGQLKKDLAESVGLLHDCGWFDPR